MSLFNHSGFVPPELPNQFGTETNDEFQRVVRRPTIDTEIHAYLSQNNTEENFNVLEYWNTVGKVNVI